MCAFNVRNGWYNRRDILKLCSWPESVDVSCVATDPVRNNILVGGCDSKDVYVFTDELKYCHTLTLSELAKYPHDMAVIDDTLLVCDFYGGRAYVFSMDGLEVKYLQEFAKPLLDGDNWSPFSMCTDKNRFAYVLWRERDWLGSACVLRYSPDGRQITTFTPVDNDARYITITEADQSQKLVIATGSSGKLYIHKLGIPLCNETK
ncbi:hypothetical protein HOLleu_25821 [Holothuria leucospilota]|uniref:Uncharacterized protein n=1 Tax=Holothuria leucospilota TaxID=206669 RepID=A0A9Q1H493_HOLLE|nr:hypothetical protein HOLleu_25821 [Holothuria leucospilota]